MVESVIYTNGLGDSITLRADGGATTSNVYFLRKIDGLGPVTTRIQEQQAPYQDGTTPVDVRLGTRTISIEGAVVNTSRDDIASTRKELCRVLSPIAGTGRLDITMRDGNVYSVFACTPRDNGIPFKAYQDIWQTFLLQFYCYDPFLYDYAPQEQDLVVYGAGFYVGSSGTDLFYVPSGGTYFGLLATLNGASDNVVNTGHCDTPVVIRFNGPATNPKVTLVETGEYVQCTMTLDSGDYIEIDTAFDRRTVTFYDASVPSTTNGNKYLNLASTFFQLPVGGNTLSFTDSGTAAGGSAVITWYNRYLGT